MRSLLGPLLVAVFLAGATEELPAQEAPSAPDVPEAAEPLPDDYSCTFCHGDSDIFFDEKENLLVGEEHLRDDIHWEKGLRCHDCHGGSPELTSFTDHREDSSFHTIRSAADIPGFCGRCHSDINYMRQFGPSTRTDQEAEYLTSGHGKALTEKGDLSVATCTSCHGRHGILSVDNQNSPVYPTRVAQMCATCHSDEKLMADRMYNERPLGHDQFEQWSGSVHGLAMLEKGDLSAPTCNDCHGNHGALPPEVGSVANACGSCHGKVSKLFAETQMKHKFQEVGLPGCATCHGSHGVAVPTDAMLGMTDGGVCAECHREGEHGATLAGGEAAETMRAMMDDLRNRIATAEETIEEAERLGMQVGGPRFDLREASDALTNARSLIHSFALEPVQEALEQGEQVVGTIQERADAALEEHTFRRIWLAAFLVPILIVVVLLMLYIRAAFPAPGKVQNDASDVQRSAADSST